jgi:hypothetical protein
VDRTTTWLRARIAECSPGPDRSPWLADKLGEATEAIFRASGMVFGMVLPPRLADRDALLAECVAALTEWLPLIDDAEILTRLGEMARRTSLPLVIAPYIAAVNAERAIDERPEDG